MSKDKRRFPRFSVSVPVALKRRGGVEELVTGDVSRHGAFIRTDSPRPERELVQLTFRTYFGDVEAMCMVARAVRAGEGARGPGMGVDLFALSKDSKERWEAFVRDVRDREAPDEGNQSALPGPSPALGAILPPPLPGDAADEAPVRRGHVRHRACFLVRTKDRQLLRELVTKDISQGGMFLRTPLLKEVGDPVELVLVHPETDEEFHLLGEVVRVQPHQTPSERGIGIRFEGLDEGRQRVLADFIESGVEHIEATVDRTVPKLIELRRAVEAEPDSPEAYEDLGAYLLETGDHAGAVATLTKALVLAPSMIDIHLLLSHAYRALGDVARAAAHERVAGALQMYRADLAKAGE